MTSKIETKEHNNRQSVQRMHRKLGQLTKRDRKQLNIFERKVYRRILRMIMKKKFGGYQLIKKFIQLLKNLLRRASRK